MNTWSTQGPEANRRRSQRVIMSIPIQVSLDNGPGKFSEKTQTLVINAHGALIALAAKVSQGQELQVKSSTHPETQACRVVYVGPTVQGKTQIGLEFTAAAPNFWHISFPPEDWSPAMVADDEQPAKGSKK